MKASWVALLCLYLSWLDPARSAVEWESNNSPPQANPVRKGRIMAGQLYSEMDQDWFRYTVRAKKNRSAKSFFQCSVEGEIPGYILRWYYASGTLQSEYSVPSGNCQSGFRFSLSTPIRGDYFFVVTPAPLAATAAWPANSGQYKFRIGLGTFANCTPCPCDKTPVMVPIPVTRENCGNQPLEQCKPTKLECQ